MTIRKRTRQSPASPAIEPGLRRNRNRPQWRWRTFPVLAAFVFGALIASFLDRPDTDFAVGIRIVLVIAAAGCLAHMFVAYVVVPRRMAARGVAPALNEEPYEEELVFEDER